MKWFSQSSLSTKLIFTTLLGGISLLIVGAINFSTIKSILKYYTHVAEINLHKTEYLGNMREHVALLSGHFNELISKVEDGVYDGDELPEIDHERKGYEESTLSYEKLGFEDDEISLYKENPEIWKKNSEIMDSILEIYALKDPNKSELLSKKVEELAIQLESHVETLGKLNTYQRYLADKWVKEAGKAASFGQNLSLASIIGFFIMALTVGLILSRNLSNKLRVLALELNRGADEVAAASSNIASTAQELSQATTEQAASLEQTAASIEEMTSMVSKNSENSINTANLASQSHNSATHGENVVKNMINSIGEINKSNQDIMEAINQSNREISEIVKVITEIGNKTKVINDIVFQTKLLSFNASVEAARAGEHGKGFAVVAEEVGNLAQMSGNAAKEISSMLEGSIQKVENIVKDTQTRVERLIEEGQTKVEQGTNIAHQCGEVLHEIVENITKVSRMADEISAASNEQSKGVSEISKAMNQLDHVTQQNAQTSDSSASSSEQLSNEATHLREAVSRLINEIEGHQSGAESHRSVTSGVSSFKSTENTKLKSNNSNVISLKNHNNTKKQQFQLQKNKKSDSKVNELSASSNDTKVRVKNVGNSSAPTPNSTTPSFDDSRFEDV